MNQPQQQQLLTQQLNPQLLKPHQLNPKKQQLSGVGSLNSLVGSPASLQLKRSNSRSHGEHDCNFIDGSAECFEGGSCCRGAASLLFPPGGPLCLRLVRPYNLVSQHNLGKKIDKWSPVLLSSYYVDNQCLRFSRQRRLRVCEVQLGNGCNISCSCLLKKVTVIVLSCVIGVVQG